jgi:DMSO/TMAO reductase YedYZ molybdopterin-dependent catalytic subunit
MPPGQIVSKTLKRWGKDHPTIGGPPPKIDRKEWSLKVYGEVTRPKEIGWSDLLKLPRKRCVSDFHCVEGWSIVDLEWEGVGVEDIIDLVKPKETAKYISFECADGYSTSLPIEDTIGENNLLAYCLNGEFLEKSHGAPLRFIVPEKYAYKSAMWILRMKFTAEQEKGYWEKRGYSETADVWKDDRYS